MSQSLFSHCSKNPPANVTPQSVVFLSEIEYKILAFNREMFRLSVLLYCLICAYHCCQRAHKGWAYGKTRARICVCSTSMAGHIRTHIALVTHPLTACPGRIRGYQRGS